MRLQKFMADAGIASRRKCEEFIAAGRVKVNSVQATVGCTVNPGDKVEFDGKLIESMPARIAYAFYKPRGVISSMEDPQGRETVKDYFKDIPVRLYNVGRLDYDSEGLLIMTNDGDLAYTLSHPSYEAKKTYYVVCDGKLTFEEQDRLRKGVMLEDGITAPAVVDGIHRVNNHNTAFTITIHEGRNRQVRRMLAAVGHETIILKRISESSIVLGDLKPGERRLLDTDEINALKKNVCHK